HSEEFVSYTDSRQKWQHGTHLVASSLRLPETFWGELVAAFLRWALCPPHGPDGRRHPGPARCTDDHPRSRIIRDHCVTPAAPLGNPHVGRRQDAGTRSTSSSMLGRLGDVFCIRPQTPCSHRRAAAEATHSLVSRRLHIQDLLRYRS